MKAIIIGAGIGGLATAIALQQVGIEVTVYERAPELRAVGAGLSLWANALHALDCIGIGDKVRRIGVTDTNPAFRDITGRALSTLSNAALVQRFGTTPLVVVHRGELMDILLQAAGNVVCCGHTFERFVQTADGVTVHFADGSWATADLLIGADGIHSGVRQQLYHDSKPIYAGYTAWRAVVPFEHTRVQGMWGESWGIGKRVGIMPIQDNRVYWFATANRPEAENLTPQASKTLLLDLFTHWHEPVPQLFRETDANSILHNDIVDINPLSKWHEGRVVLLGDAVHAMTPNMGQGACQALEDAIVLARSLQTTPKISDALTCYVTLRQARTRHIQLQSRRIGQAGQIANPALCWLRNQAFALLPSQLQIRMLDDVVGYDIATPIEATS